MDDIKPGYYRHFKGGEYEVLGTARHSEGEEPLVVYRPLYGDFGLWVRPATMFDEIVDVNGEEMPRFSFVSARRPQRLLSAADYQRARDFIVAQARPLERCLHAYRFEGGSPESVLTELGRFQNSDGGFGRGLEPDLQTPDSSVLATTVALQTLRSLQAGEQHPLVRGAMRFLRDTYDDEQQRWPFIPPTANNAPHAPWWTVDAVAESFGQFLANPRAEVVGYLFEYPSYSTTELRASLLHQVMAWLDEAGETLEMHDFLCFQRLAETPGLPAPAQETLLSRLTQIAQSIVVTEPSSWAGYGLQPLDIAGAPDSPFAATMLDAIGYNLDYVIEHQTEDGSWRPAWNWGDAYPDAWTEAERQWSGVITLNRLRQLSAYGRIEKG